MKCIIESAHDWRIESLVDEYAKTILEAGFTLERLDKGEDHDAKLLIELEYMEDLKRLADAVENEIIFDPQHLRNDIYPTLIIYDDYLD